MANQISQTEIGALGQISACVETITQKLGYVPITDYLYSSPSQLKAAAELVEGGMKNIYKFRGYQSAKTSSSMPFEHLATPFKARLTYHLKP